MSNSEEAPTELYKQVVNAAQSYHTTLEETSTSYDIEETCKLLWKQMSDIQASEWYSSGNITNKGIRLKRGSDVLDALVKSYLFVVKKYMRDNNQEITSSTKAQLQMFQTMSEIIIADSIETVHPNINTLHPEQVIAYLFGVLISQYNQIKDLYE